eukprot:6182600-Pleurochrysis_carterae.AAC.3
MLSDAARRLPCQRSVLLELADAWSVQHGGSAEEWENFVKPDVTSCLARKVSKTHAGCFQLLILRKVSTTPAGCFQPRSSSPAAMALTLHTISEWEEHVLKRSDGRYILVSFSASWCGACKRMHPVFEDLAGRSKAVVFVAVDVVELEPVAGASHVAALPAFQATRLLRSMFLAHSPKAAVCPHTCSVLMLIAACYSQIWKDGEMVEKFEGSNETKLSILADKYDGISRARNM